MLAAVLNFAMETGRPGISESVLAFGSSLRLATLCCVCGAYKAAMPLSLRRGLAYVHIPVGTVSKQHTQ